MVSAGSVGAVVASGAAVVKREVRIPLHTAGDRQAPTYNERDMIRNKHPPAH